jgi:hypothetical protein
LPLRKTGNYISWISTMLFYMELLKRMCTSKFQMATRGGEEGKGCKLKKSLYGLKTMESGIEKAVEEA